MKRSLALLITLTLLFAFTACSAPAAKGDSLAPGEASSTPNSTPNTGAPGAGKVAAGNNSTPSASTDSRPYAEWVGVWESELGVMTIRFSHHIDFVLDCYYYYPDDGFGFQINISDDEVDGSYIHSYMIDPMFDYHAEYEFTLSGGSFDFIYHYQQEVIEESTFTRTAETDIEGTWQHYWDL